MLAVGGEYERKLTAVLHADVAGYSRMSGADEETTHGILRKHCDVLAALIEAHGGRVVNTAGDAVLADFPSAVGALAAAIEAQRAIAGRNEALAEAQRLKFRIGINLGDVIVDRGDLYGDGVNVAARLESLSVPGGICISESMRDAVGNKVAGNFEYLGEKTLKNIDKPVRAYRVIPDGEAPTRRGARVSSGKSGRWRVPALAAALILAIALAAGLLVERFRGDTGSAGVAEVRLSIAVMRFANNSNDPTQEYFVSGITDDLITELTKVRGLLVIARESIDNLGDSPRDWPALGRLLDVGYFVAGSIRRTENRVRINANLIEAATGGQIWSERYDGQVGNVFDLQDRITSQIVGALAVELGADIQQIRTSQYTSSTEAYENFLRGRESFFRFSKADNLAAQGFYQKALVLDPEFARAWVMLAWTHNVDYQNGWSDSPVGSLDRAIELSDKGLALDDSLPIAHFVKGLAYREKGEYVKAIVETEKATELDPNYANAHVLHATLLYYAGRPAEGLARMQKAIRLNPLHPSNYPFHLGQAYFILKRYGEAVAAFQKGLDTNPTSQRLHLWLAASLAQAGQTDDAEWESDLVMTLDPDFSLDRVARMYPFTDTADRDHLLAGLQKAGFN